MSSQKDARIHPTARALPARREIHQFIDRFLYMGRLSSSGKAYTDDLETHRERALKGNQV